MIDQLDALLSDYDAGKLRAEGFVQACRAIASMHSADIHPLHTVEAAERVLLGKPRRGLLEWEPQP